MDFKEVLLGVGFALVLIIAFFGFTNSLNDAYGTSVGQNTEFNATINKVVNDLQRDFVNKSIDYAGSTQPEEGQGTSDTAGESAWTRAFRSLGLIDDLIGLIPSLLNEAGNALNVPEIYVSIAKAVFWIAFAITLMYLLILGVNKLL